METDLSLSDIAAECGFCNPNYFGDIFKLVNGISPSEFSKNNKPNTKQSKGFTSDKLDMKALKSLY
ncbi:AraC family transcriptional regulator [Eubacterium sp. AM49-13BH]|nr:AraC family transcriptional regulator [Eubacterium sp. AM49-13BH]